MRICFAFKQLDRSISESQEEHEGHSHHLDEDLGLVGGIELHLGGVHSHIHNHAGDGVAGGIRLLVPPCQGFGQFLIQSILFGLR